jgi:hypothetical protein
MVDRQRGSHIILRHTKPPHRRLVVPDHDEIAKGTLRALLRDAGLTIEDLRRLLERIGAAGCASFRTRPTRAA